MLRLCWRVDWFNRKRKRLHDESINDYTALKNLFCKSSKRWHPKNNQRRKTFVIFKCFLKIRKNFLEKQSVLNEKIIQTSRKFHNAKNEKEQLCKKIEIFGEVIKAVCYFQGILRKLQEPLDEIINIYESHIPIKCQNNKEREQNRISENIKNILHEAEKIYENCNYQPIDFPVEKCTDISEKEIHIGTACFLAKKIGIAL